MSRHTSARALARLFPAPEVHLGNDPAPGFPLPAQHLGSDPEGTLSGPTRAAIAESRKRRRDAQRAAATARRRAFLDS